MGRGGKSRKVRRAAGVQRENQDQDQDQPLEWMINILKEGADYDSGRSWTIYRVPRNMQGVYRNAYVPKIISIGPFHYRDHELQFMEEHKMRYLWRLLGQRLQANGAEAEDEVVDMQVSKATRLEDLARAMGALEQKTRVRYSETFYMDSDEFVQMMVVDGCFVVELLRLYYKFDNEEIVDDPIFTTRWMLRTLQRDLLMLENQLPFFVLQEVFKLTSLPNEPSLIDLILKFFDPVLPRKNIKVPSVNELEEEFDHMLDVFRSTFLSSLKISTSEWKQRHITSANIPLVEERQLIHCVTELQDAGVTFKMRKDRDLLDIKFERGVLQIPPLYIDDNTVPLFLNLVAFEQCDQDAKPFFTNFFMFFDSLINSGKDVEILHKMGIINHVLGSNKDVANLFHRLGREIVYDLDECYLAKQMKGVNEYYKAYHATKWHVWWTKLKRDYFSSPWTFLSLLAAIFLLLLTAAQTAYSAAAYYKQISKSNM